MARFFNFYDPLEKRYVFNSFLIVVGLVEIGFLPIALYYAGQKHYTASEIEPPRVAPGTPPQAPPPGNRPQ